MSKTKKSGSAILMYWLIALSAVTSACCFGVYYGDFCGHDAVLWTGIVAFMIMYHLWMRIIMGNVSKLFPISFKQRWFREKPFEKRLYRLLRVKKWKGKALTYNPELFSLKKYSPKDVANVMAKAETDHWINEVISLSSLLFSILWGQFWIFLVTAFAAMLFDAQFIVIQRFNRPRILALVEQKERLRERRAGVDRSNKKVSRIGADSKISMKDDACEYNSNL